MKETYGITCAEGKKKKKKGMRCLVVPVPKLEIADEGSRSKANKSWRFLM